MNYVYIAGPLFDDHERNYLESIAEIFETRGYKTFLPPVSYTHLTLPTRDDV